MHQPVNDPERRAAMIARGRVILARREAEADAADREAALTVRLAPTQVALLQKVAANWGRFTTYEQDATYKALMRLAARGFLVDSCSAGIRAYHFVLTRLGAYVAECRGATT